MKTNYHTHTTRCMHAAGSDEDYIRAALDGGFDVLGFSDHAPWPFRTGYVSNIRMPASALQDYIDSIQSLKAKYSGRLSIHTGLECEWFPGYRDWMLRMRDMGIEYYILGQHYVISEEDHPYVGFTCRSDDGVCEYADSVCEALLSGLYVCLAHPDLFMRYRTEDQFNHACEEAAVKICQAAIETHTPLEFNLHGYDFERKGAPRGYPCRAFWQIARSFQNSVILGVDAHDPNELLDIPLWDDGMSRAKACGCRITEKIDSLD